MITSRRAYFKLLSVAPLLASTSTAADEPARLRAAICAYSFRKELKSGAMTYADVIRMAAENGSDGIDLTAYWLPDTNDDTLFALKKLAYRLSVSDLLHRNSGTHGAALARIAGFHSRVDAAMA